MVLRQVNDNGNEHWERLFLVCLQDVEEIVILEETHSSISNLQMDTANTLDDSFEKLWDQVFNFINLTNFEDFLQLRQEKCFFDAVSKWPKLEKSIKKWDSQCSIFGQEKHRASQKLLVKLRACLHFVKWNDDVLEKNNMLISQRNSESTDNASQNIKKLCSPVELMVLVNKCEELLVDSLSNHFTSWNELGI